MTAREAYGFLARRGAAFAADIRGTAGDDGARAAELYDKVARTPEDKASFFAFLLDEGEPAVKAQLEMVLRDMFLGDCEARVGEED